MTAFANVEGSFMNTEGCQVLRAPSIGLAAPAVVHALVIAADIRVAHQVHEPALDAKR